MRAYRMREADGRRLLSLDDMPQPEPSAGQLLVRVRAAGLNRGELLGGHGAVGAVRPLGTEAAGEVIALGRDVRGWHLGDRVMGRCSGAFADHALIDAREAMAVPAVLDWLQAGALPLTFLVVYDMLVAQGALRDGETLLVAGVTSGVGVAALQAAKAIGAKVIGTSGNERKLERLRRIGLDLGIRTRGGDFVDAVRTATQGRGADVVIDCVGGSVFPACIAAMAFEGRLAMVGYVDGQLHAELDLAALHGKRLRLFGVSNKQRTPDQRAETVRGFRPDWLPLFAAGRLAPLVDRTYPFEELEAAITAMESEQHVGKIVLEGSRRD